ncbi:hypothetical protein Taro_038613 [Colocasia esculenta]|uniref:Uncharacterized protein n=1 Tax=Colocasia esculenta TaxID=4460 RepID=A0A843WED2_COLES|nr:hypothetical protein [Colocasia esculenta]
MAVMARALSDSSPDRGMPERQFTRLWDAQKTVHPIAGCPEDSSPDCGMLGRHVPPKPARAVIVAVKGVTLESPPAGVERRSVSPPRPLGGLCRSGRDLGACITSAKRASGKIHRIGRLGSPFGKKHLRDKEMEGVLLEDSRQKFLMFLITCRLADLKDFKKVNEIYAK